MKNIFNKKWLQAVVLFAPFTGIIDGGWFVLLLVSYIIGFCIYLYNE
jgi:hypothetical protein